MIGEELDRLVRMLSRLPGLGPRSARRVALHMLANKDEVMHPLADAIKGAADSVRTCSNCGNLDVHDPCDICTDTSREDATLCVVEQVADLWALERSGSFRGRYHVLGGVLSALDGVTPEDIGVPQLRRRAAAPAVEEIILALNATVEGQTTAHYLADRLARDGLKITRLAQGVPVGGELDYLDDGTLLAAMKSRKAL